jgi:hypothetical protein
MRPDDPMMTGMVTMVAANSNRSEMVADGSVGSGALTSPPFDVFNNPVLTPNPAPAAPGDPQFYNAEVTQRVTVNITEHIDLGGNLIRSTIAANGTDASLGGNGVLYQVGTNTRLDSVVRNVDFTGNRQADFATVAATTGMTPDSVDTMAGPDQVFLDDTAQLDLVFTRNTGNMVNATAMGALFSNPMDPFKTMDREAGFFQVFQTDLGLNTFSQLGVPQDLTDPTEWDGYRLHTDPFPDPTFP